MQSVTAETLIGDALRICPEASALFEEYLGECSSCMGMEFETIAYGAQLHDTDPDLVVAKINALIASNDMGK